MHLCINYLVLGIHFWQKCLNLLHFNPHLIINFYDSNILTVFFFLVCIRGASLLNRKSAAGSERPW